MNLRFYLFVSPVNWLKEEGSNDILLQDFLIQDFIFQASGVMQCVWRVC